MLLIRGGTAALAALASVAASDGTVGSQAFMAACQTADVGREVHLVVESAWATGIWDLDYNKNDHSGGGVKGHGSGSDGRRSSTPDDGSSYSCGTPYFDYLETCSMTCLCFGYADTVKKYLVRGSVLHFLLLYGLSLFVCFVISCCFISYCFCHHSKDKSGAHDCADASIIADSLGRYEGEGDCSFDYVKAEMSASLDDGVLQDE
jgi:hypothetical protein